MTITLNGKSAGAFTPSFRVITTAYVPIIKLVGLMVKVEANKVTQAGPDDFEIVTSLYR